ncbi:MarR family winged helix-turn-helix transcriptional regulator [Arthrobacter sp. HS15c]|uniref:MarR family winged helix-turn-helix transcriptional regulator n=1 Tax=Arthrobacter sp. HS15c TaxID=3230279 RepID=UPI003467ED7A
MAAESERDLPDGCRLLSLAARLVQRRQDGARARLGLTRAAVIALEGLAAGALNQEQLAVAVHAKSPTLGRVLARLQAAGLVSRSRHPRDRRMPVVGLTGAGRAALQAATANHGRGSPPPHLPDRAPPSFAQPVPITSRSRTRHPPLSPTVHSSYQIKK